MLPPPGSLISAKRPLTRAPGARPTRRPASGTARWVVPVAGCRGAAYSSYPPVVMPLLRRLLSDSGRCGPAWMEAGDWAGRPGICNPGLARGDDRRETDGAAALVAARGDLPHLSPLLDGQRRRRGRRPARHPGPAGPPHLARGGRGLDVAGIPVARRRPRL